MTLREEIKGLLKQLENRIATNGDYKDSLITKAFRDLKEKIRALPEGPDKNLSCLEAIDAFVAIFPMLPAVVQRSFVEYSLELWKEKEPLLKELEKPQNFVDSLNRP